MPLLNEIRECFASASPRTIRKLDNIALDYPAWIIRKGKEYGVAIEYDGPVISEHFSNCKIHSEELTVSGSTRQYLTLTCLHESLRHQFASVCAQFVDPGTDGVLRKKLLNDPTGWWEEWRSLMGNASIDRQVYSVIAEMLILNHLFKTDKTIEWTATKAGSKDIENEEESFEVKSTIVRYGATITIAGQHQLRQTKPAHLYFCRMESSPTGYSIDDVKNMLVKNGYQLDRIEDELTGMGFEAGSSDRKKKYKVLEVRKYDVNDDFPKVTISSFVDGKMPPAIIQFTYTIDLEEVSDYEVIEL